MRLLALVFVLFISGCTLGPKFNQLHTLSEDDAGLYIYRPTSIVNSLVNPTVYFNGEAISDLGNGQYVFIKSNSGQHKLKLGGTNSFSWPFAPLEVSVELENGKSVFVEMSSSFAITGYYVVYTEFENGVALARVPEAHALKKLKVMRRSLPPEKRDDSPQEYANKKRKL